MKVQLKDNIYIGAKNGYILTFQKLIKGEDSDNAGDEYFSSALTYLNASYAVRGICQSYGVIASHSEILAAYKEAQKQNSIQAAKAGREAAEKKAELQA